MMTEEDLYADLRALKAERAYWMRLREMAPEGSLDGQRPHLRCAILSAAIGTLQRVLEFGALEADAIADILHSARLQQTADADKDTSELWNRACTEARQRSAVE